MIGNRQNIYKKKILLSAVISIAVYLLLVYILPPDNSPISLPSLQASQEMAKALSIIKKYRTENNLSINKETDPNLTGLIGPQHTSLTTSLGHLQAKRTTTNPNFAGLIVYLLTKAGIEKGDKVAIGSSASFPALMIASVCATEALEAIPVTILSLGSSSYGANNPEFNLLHIYELLHKKKIFSHPPSAVSLGGESDVGENINSELKQKLIHQIEERDIAFIFEKNLRENVKKRLIIYKKDSEVDAFINCGGSIANLGTSSLILQVKPGIIEKLKIPEKNKRGVLFEMAAKNIPCIHLLFIQGLVQKYNLEWDPVPLPQAKGYSADKLNKNRKILTVFIGVSYLILMGLLYYKKFAFLAIFS